MVLIFIALVNVELLKIHLIDHYLYIFIYIYNIMLRHLIDLQTTLITFNKS
jgi:hypothetical protein